MTDIRLSMVTDDAKVFLSSLGIMLRVNPVDIILLSLTVPQKTDDMTSHFNEYKL